MTVQIGRLTLPGKAWLAPMAGVSDVAFRVLCVKHGAAVAPTEFLSANALARDNVRVQKMAEVSDQEHVRIIQIFGQNEANIGKTVKWITEQGCYDCIDMNLGCPSPKILLQGAGSALLRRPDKIEGILRAVKENTDLPWSIKIRIGMNDSTLNGLEICKLAEKMGANHVAIHGRTVKQGYAGKSNWEYIKQCVDALSIPVIANGDIVDGASAKECLEFTGAAGVMVGRAARANPFVFADINSVLTGNDAVTPTAEEKLQAFLDYLQLYRDFGLDDYGALKSHAMQFTKGLAGGADVRKQITFVKTVDELEDCMRKLTV